MNPSTRSWRPGATVPFVIALLALAPLAAAQGAASGDAAASADAPPAVVEVADPPAAAAFGVAFGFPAYRTASLSASLQAGAVGAAVRAAWGSAGVAVGLQARAYPPLPWPVPTYVAVGADLYGGALAPHVALGVHVPLGERWRLDAEGGVAWPPLLDARPVTPYLSLGVGYAFAIDAAPRSAAPATVAAGAAPRAAATCAADAPDAASLDAAVAETVRRFVADATAAYGSLYRDLRYTTRIVGRDVQGVDARVSVAYEGSVVERASGRRLEAAGTAVATYRWRGCAWTRTALEY